MIIHPSTASSGTFDTVFAVYYVGKSQPRFLPIRPQVQVYQMIQLNISLVQAIFCQKWPMIIPGALSSPSSLQGSRAFYAMEVRLSLGARWQEGEQPVSK